MAKTATKTKKVTKKASTAKGKGKVVKKAVKKAPAKKPVVKRAPKAVDPNKYGKFYIVDAPTDKFPDMVTITAAPKLYDDLIGRRYINRGKCMATIDAVRIGDSIDKGAKSVVKELDSIGLAPLEPADTDEEK